AAIAAYSPNGIYGISPRSLGLHVGGPDYLRPFFGFVGDELAEIGRRPCNHRTAHFCEARPNPWIGERRVDFPVELVDDLRWCTPRSADPKKCTRLVARHELAHCRGVWQPPRARCCGHRQDRQFARLDVLD